VNRLVSWTPTGIASHYFGEFRVRHAWSFVGAGLQAAAGRGIGIRREGNRGGYASCGASRLSLVEACAR
jgi:hypothetical protein